MSKRNRAAKAQPDKKIRHRFKQTVVEERTGNLAGLAQLPGGLIATAAAGTLQAQAARLGDARLQTVQRQALAAQIGRVQGNQHLQRIVTLQKRGKKPASDLSKGHIGQEMPAHEAIQHVVKSATGNATSSRKTLVLAGHSSTIQAKQRNPSSGEVVQLRRATWFERRAWLSFFSHYLPRKLLSKYMSDMGGQITLTQQEMIDCNPIVDLRRSRAFLQEVVRLRSVGGGTNTIAVSGWGGARTNGTLGNFTINYIGQLSVSSTGDWSFTGTMNFYDYWNFDPKSFGSGSGRPISAEIKVRVAAAFIPGHPFHVYSVRVPVSQTSAQPSAAWAGGSPTHVPEASRRAGADIEVEAEAGAGAGGVEAGAGGVEVGTGVGGEAGAQSAEDLNR
jgi:hypothetical protein